MYAMTALLLVGRRVASARLPGRHRGRLDPGVRRRRRAGGLRGGDCRGASRSTPSATGSNCGDRGGALCCPSSSGRRGCGSTQCRTARAWTERLGTIVWLTPSIVAWLVGALVRVTRLNAEQRRVNREQRAAQAVADERNRIARELHDVIGHSLSVMTVQASAVRRRLRPEQAVERQALETVETVGREALTEMRRMVGVLRGSGADPDLEPPPGLDQLERLAEKFRAAGLPVSVSVTGQARELAPGLDLTAYRLVQEGLTNTLRHARNPQRAEVAIAYCTDRIQLAVRDDGQPAAVSDIAGRGRRRAAGNAGTRRRLRRFAGGPGRAARRLRAGRHPASGAGMSSTAKSSAAAIGVLDRRRPDAGAGRLPDDPRDRA